MCENLSKVVPSGASHQTTFQKVERAHGINNHDGRVYRNVNAHI